MKPRFLLVFLGAALLFSLSSVFLKFNSTLYGIGFIESTLSRFGIGFIIMFAFLLIRKENLRPNKPNLLIWRGALNALAVIGFFLAITLTTVTKSNLLSQLYPAFLLIIAPFLNKEKTSLSDISFLALAIVGAFLAILPVGGIGQLFSGGDILGDIIAILDAIVSAFAVSVLKEARKYDSTSLVILWQFGTGTIIAIILCFFGAHMPPNLNSWLLLIGTGLCGFFGQVLITWGWKFVKSSTGGIILYSGIIFSAIFGLVWFDDLLTFSLIVGGIIIIGSLTGLSIVQAKKGI